MSFSSMMSCSDRKNILPKFPKCRGGLDTGLSCEWVWLLHITVSLYLNFFISGLQWDPNRGIKKLCSVDWNPLLTLEYLFQENWFERSCLEESCLDTSALYEMYFSHTFCPCLYDFKWIMQLHNLVPVPFFPIFNPKLLSMHLSISPWPMFYC